MAIEEITIDDYTTTELAGDGVFDVMMRAVKSHVQEEYNQNRIRGTDYSTVYLGALTSTMQQSLQFLLSKDEVFLKAQMLEIELEKLEIEKLKMANEAALIAAQTLKIEAEIPLVEAQVALVNAQKLETEAKTDLIEQQRLNAILERDVMDAQICKLKAEFDLLVETKLKTVSETNVLNQKKITEVAQTNGAGVTTDSVIGRQNALYTAQANGFSRDAEQKAAKIMVDTWNVRRTTNEETLANDQNLLDDNSIGAAIQQLLGGIGATIG